MLSGALSFISLPLLSRALGAADYGLFNFLRFFFEKAIQFFDLGTSGFYPQFSKRPGDRSILRFVILYDLILFFVSIVLLFLLIISGKTKEVLTTSSLVIILPIFSFVWFFIINGKMTELMDALGRTVTNETVLFGTRLALTIGMLGLFFFNKLNLYTYLALQNVVFVISLLYLVYLAKRFIPKEEHSQPFKQTRSEFRKYSQPLFMASIVGIITGLGDRWVLQIFGGAVQQGYYSFGLNLGTICFLLTGSVTPLLIREYAIAHAKQDKQRIAALFSKFLPIFYMLTATISCFLATHGDWTSPILGGSDFKKAAIPVMLLSLAPIHQTYGQLSGGLMVATNRTKIYGQINMFIALIGLPVTYICIAPKAYFGLDLGATGLALKMVLLQIIGVNIQIWYNTKYLGIGMLKFIIQQILLIFFFIVIGFGARLVVSEFLQPGIPALIFSGILYLSGILFIICLWPGLISITRKEILGYIKMLLSNLNK